MHHFLYLKKSLLPGAGKGLFTKKDIAKGERIIEYKGRIQTWKEAIAENRDNPYLFYINSKTVINPVRSKKLLAHFANDASGIVKVKGLKNNAEYVVEGKRCFIEAIRNIKKGEEIFVEYGGDYWAVMRENARLEKKKSDKRK